MVDATQKRPETFLENAIFYFCLLLLAVAVGAYFYFWSSVSRVKGEINDLNVLLEQTKTAENKDLDGRLEAARRKLADFSEISAKRKSPTRFFNKLEELASGNVYYNKCDLDLEKMKLNLSAHGNSFQDMGRQMLKLGAGNFGNAGLVKAAASKTGGVDFEVSAVLPFEMVSARGTASKKISDKP